MMVDLNNHLNGHPENSSNSVIVENDCNIEIAWAIKAAESASIHVRWKADFLSFDLLIYLWNLDEYIIGSRFDKIEIE